MLDTHLFAMIPLLVILTLSMVFYGRGLIHLMGLAYSITLAFMAISNTWEVIFFPIIALMVIIELILFLWAMSKGDWI